MSRGFRLEIGAEDRRTLERWVARHRLPYVRERAAALLKVAGGMSINEVAASGLLRPYDPHSVRGWIQRFLDEGPSGLIMREGRGRKPSFPPSANGAEGR